VERRPLKRHRLWGLGVCIRLSIPLLISCMFFGLIYLRMSQSTHDIYKSSLVAHAMGDRTVCQCSARPQILRTVVSQTTHDPFNSCLVSHVMSECAHMSCRHELQNGSHVAQPPRPRRACMLLCFMRAAALPTGRLRCAT
jgi:hypothetical protein